MTTTPREVTLQFPSFYTMWRYIKATHLQFFELVITTAILYTQCTEEEVILAETAYGAHVVTKANF